MDSWAMEAIQCRHPARTYGLYLKDQWLQFQINTLAQRGITPFQNQQQFSELCSTSSSEDKAKLAEFYLHNLALPNEVSWDPNTALGRYATNGTRFMAKPRGSESSRSKSSHEQRGNWAIIYSSRVWGSHCDHYRASKLGHWPHNFTEIHG